MLDSIIKLPVDGASRGASSTKTELNPVERWSLPGIASQTKGLAPASTQGDSPIEMQY